MKYLFLLCALLIFSFTRGQNTNHFASEVAAIQKKYDTLIDPDKETIVFVGSSSIRMWHDLQKRFPEHQIVNAGFGGSQASDLLLYTNELILNYKPKKVFLYEGDNDIFAGKKSDEIIADMMQIIQKIKAQNPSTKVVLLSAKPSLARWKYRRRYKKLNRHFKKLSSQDAHIDYIDLWSPMLNKRKVMKDIFIEDGLHMNAKGYAIWYNTIKPFIN